ncbi:MAG: M56 family metallopeptidase [Candidatus Aminicenantes bacterium]|nr:M56 family metallopeptidase [Candidatus Aminicenantes bacterium]
MSLLNNIVSAEWVLNAAFQTLLILGAGALLVYLFRHKAAPLRSGISLITMLALILLPFLSVSLNELGYLPLRIVLPITIGQTSSPSVSVDHDMVGMPLDTTDKGITNSFRLFWTGPVVVKIINIFGIIWGIGFLYMILRFVLGTISIRNLKKGMVEVCNPRISAIMNAAEKVFSEQNKARLFVSKNAPSPMAVGIFKPIILIPESLLHKLRNSQIREILLHELSHIYHKDQITGILQRLVTALNWWNPLAYALSTSHSRAREEISDNYVLLQNDSKEYAECLINLAEKTALLKRLPVSVGLASPHIPLKDRVKHILSKERNMDTNLKKSTITVMVLTAFLVLLGIAGSRLTFATAKPEAPIKKADLVLPDLQEQDQQNQEEEKKKSEKKNIKPPKLIKQVEPIYPEEARKAGIEGVVTLEATTDKYGRVQDVKVLNSVPGLDQAAIDAVKQWVYEPMVIDGKPYGVTFTSTYQFSLKNERHGKSFEVGVTGTDKKPPVPAAGNIKPPKLIKMVKPVYPEAIKKAGVEGVIIIEATTDVYGRVINTKILRGIPLLDQAARDAVKQWIYEPMIINGEPRGVMFVVTYKFRLDEPVRAVGEIKPPKLIKQVEPIYPEVATKAGIEGVVIIEVTTDVYGRVVNTKILRGIPVLDQAARDAVKQWIYEPKIIDGKPRGVIFIVTVVFELQ